MPRSKRSKWRLFARSALEHLRRGFREHALRHLLKRIPRSAQFTVGIFIALLRVSKMVSELFIDLGERANLLGYSRETSDQVSRAFLDLLALQAHGDGPSK